MGLLARHPRIRWAAPAAALALVAGGAILAATSADAADHPSLPHISAQQLLVDLQTPTTDTLQGTVTYDAHLGLPSLPTGLTNVGGSGTGGPEPGAPGGVVSSLLSGSHTLRVWADGPTRARVAVVDGTSETDVIHNGSDLWTWSSVGQRATHTTLPRSDAGSSTALAGQLPATPQEAAQQVLAAIEPSTAVTTDSTAKVAGRSAYRLTLDPRDAGTLVDRVVISVDAATHVPLRVDVYSTQRTAPALEIGFTSVSFATPDASRFTFTPPRGVTEKQVAAPSLGHARTDHSAAKATEPTVVGDGWDQVMVARLTPAEQAEIGGEGSSGDQLGALLRTLPTVSGDWGSGHVVAGTLFSAVVTADDRVAVGAVPVSVLTAALAQG